MVNPRLSSAAMTTPGLPIRRATIEDLPQLIPLWTERGLAPSDLEKRFKEFQVMEGEGGVVLGAFGLQIAGQEAAIHSEVFAQPEQADEVRARLWERVQVIIKNHGLVRLWTQSPGPFWSEAGFNFAAPEVLAKRPSALEGTAGPWLFLQLRDDANPLISIDKEFAIFRESERESTERLFRQARIMKIVAGVIAVAVLILVILWAISFFKMQGRAQPR